MSLSNVDESDRLDEDGPVDRPPFDVFLSYRTVDGPVVREVARRLREAGVTVWFAEDSIPVGADWQDELEARLMDCGSCAIFRGPAEIAGWVSNEMKVAIDRGTRDHDFPVFAVVLPGIEYFDSSMLPRFLATKQYVDLRAGPESADAIQRLISAIYRLPPQHPSVDVEAGECPYRGLEVFEEEHARYFFGREAEVQRLLENLRRDRFLAVLGQSGVGKSSLIRAGLLPELRKGAVHGSAVWRLLLLRPGAEPTTALAARILALQPGPGMEGTIDRLLTNERTLHQAATLALAEQPTGSKLLVVVDQFEEVFTLCRDPAERAAFLNNLYHAATVAHGHTVVVLVLRSDFYPRLAEYAAFAQLTQSRHVLVARMSDEELRAVIREPAYAVGLTVEQGLADTILDDVERDPGNLPLLEHALLETWRHRHNGMLTLAGYRESGGVQRGLGERAEALYDALSDTGRAEARKLFLRLVQPGEGTADTRRRVALSEVMSGDDDPVADVIRLCVDARLLTTSQDDATGARRIEISHEAVITGWARCARWVDEDRAGLLVHRRLTRAAQEWDRHGRSPDVLYRGVPLAETIAWRTRSEGRLNWQEQDFLDAAITAERVGQRGRRRRIQIVFAALLAVAVLIAVIAVVAVGQGNEAARQRDVAKSRQLAAEASNALAVDPALGLTLALRAVDVSPTTQAEEMLRRATAESHGRSMVEVGGGPVYGVRFLPDGAHAVSGSADGILRLWNLGDGTIQRVLAVHTKAIYAVRVSPDGSAVASASQDGTVALTTLSDGQSRILLRAPVAVSSVEFSHRGTLLAASLYDGSVRLVDLASGEATLLPGTDLVNNAAFSTDDSLLATAGRDGVVRIWNLRDRTQRVIAGDRGPVIGVEFSRATGKLATAGDDGAVRFWDPVTGAAAGAFQIDEQTVFVARFTPDGQRLVVAGFDGVVHLWDLAGFAAGTLRGHAGSVLDVDVDPAGTDIVSVGTDGTLRMWQLDRDAHARAPMTAATFNRDATRIVTGAPDGRLRVWATDGLRQLLDMPDHPRRSYASYSSDGSRILSYGEEGGVNVRAADDGRLLAAFDPGVGSVWSVAPDHADRRLVVGGENGAVRIVDGRGTMLETLSATGRPVYAVAFSPDDGSVVAGRADGTVTLWSPERAPTVLSTTAGAVNALAFSPDGALVASADDSGSVRLTDTRGTPVAELRGHGGAVKAVRFSADGGQLVSGGVDRTVRVWDARSHELLRAFDPSDGPAESVDLSPDGSTILRSSEVGHALRLLSCEVCGSLDSVVTLARAHAFRRLTAEEERRYIS